MFLISFLSCAHSEGQTRLWLDEEIRVVHVVLSIMAGHAVVYAL